MTGECTNDEDGQVAYMEGYAATLVGLSSHYPEGLKTDKSAQDLDRELNQKYRQLILALKAKHLDDGIGGVRDAQADWMQFRDEMIRLGLLVYRKKYSAQKIANNVTAYLSQQRIAVIDDHLQWLADFGDGLWAALPCNRNNAWIYAG